MTAIIISEEEAMALPQAKRPLCFRVPSSIYHDTFVAIGAASMCWNPQPSGQVYNSDKASQVAVELLFKIAAELERLGITSEQMRQE